MPLHILTVHNKHEEQALRKKVALFDFKAMAPPSIRQLVSDMKKTMRAAAGVGLSANQIGLDMRVFIAYIESKFYAVFNPTIVKLSPVTEKLEEGCLSVPNVFGKVRRADQIVITGFNPRGKKVRIKARGLLAQVFQHELDHLDGMLFTDKATELFRLEQEQRKEQ